MSQSQLRRVPWMQIRYHIQPFHLQESGAYIKHCLRVTGAESFPISDSFIAAAHQFSHGAPCN